MMLKQSLAMLALLGLVVALGCGPERRADVQDVVEQRLEQAGLDDVRVDTDTEQNIVALEGDVRSQDQKNRAEEIAREAAPGWVVANRIGVRPDGMEDRAEDVAGYTDDAIENSVKAQFTQRGFDEHDINVNVENAVVTLEGEVNNAQLRQQAEQIAADVPNVQQVVNKIEVRDNR